jgi:hypothetical protein
MAQWTGGSANSSPSGNGWKIVRNDEKPAQFHDLAPGMGETTDLSVKHPLTFKELETPWKAWDSTLTEPPWGGRRKR